jgi:hypothetical protein
VLLLYLKETLYFSVSEDFSIFCITDLSTFSTESLGYFILSINTACLLTETGFQTSKRTRILWERKKTFPFGFNGESKGV